MRWSALLALTLAFSVAVSVAIPVSFDSENSKSKLGNDIIFQSELSPRLRRGDQDSVPISKYSTSTDRDEDQTSTLASSEIATQQAESRSDDISDVLRALNLPEDFVEKKGSNSAVSKDSSPSGRNDLVASGSQNKNSVSSKPPTEISPVSAAAGDVQSSSPRIARQYYMTGNQMLDKIMNCPCGKDQLNAVGVKGVEYSNEPDPAIYREPPYGPNALGPGDVIASNLKSVGGTTGNVFGQMIRLILGLPNLILSLLKPLIVGAADTLAQTTDAAAGVTQQAAKSVPVAVRSGALVLKRLLETFGDVAGGLLHVISNLVASLAAAKTSLSGTLPFAFDIVGDVSGRVAQTVGTAVDWVAGTKEILSTGVVNAAKTKGNLFAGLVEGSKGFGQGLLEGIKYGVNDEKPPEDPASSAW